MPTIFGKSAILLVVPLLLPSTFLQKPEIPKEDRIIFAVWAPQKGKRPEAFILDPIVRIKGSTLTSAIPEGKDSEAASDQFEKTYFAPGKSYSLLFGGSDYGTVTVDKAESISCESNTATATVSKSTPVGLDGLAASTLRGIRVHENWRHVASDEQKAEFVHLASEYLKSHGSEDIVPGSLKIPSLRTTRLVQGGPDVLIGSVSLVQKTRVHDLFLVMQLPAEKAQILIASYHLSQDPEDGTDRQQEKFVDQMDLDGDGTDEIVTLTGYYESWSYSIYKVQNGEWKRVYTGGGGGC